LGQELVAIDLSQTLSNATADVEVMPHRITYADHRDTVEVARGRLGLGPEHWRGGLGWAQETVMLTSHSGTHIDAPYHYAPQTTAGAPARTIEDVPLGWLMTEAHLLDMRHVDPTEGIRRADVVAELERIGARVHEGDAVLIRTDASLRFGQKGYDQTHIGMRADATRFLLECGAKLLGIDAWGFDRPTLQMAELARAGDTDQLWESHYLGAELEYAQIEKLVNLAAIPRATEFSVAALPIKLERGSGGWARVVALCPV
jgi:kynurenine formamidase